MFEVFTIIVCVITLILLKFFLNINFKKIRKLEIRSSDELKSISNKFPEDKQICKDILKKLDKANVNIKREPEYASCLYTVFNNTITIGKFKQNYMKIQTIAHECIHSAQNKIMLWSNFIFTNIYIIYFITILILEFLNRLPYANIHILILMFLSFIQYILRNTLETEAMIKAKYLAKEYIEENKILDRNEEEKLLEEYDKINNIGLPFMNYYIISMNIIKIMIFSFVVLV